MVITDKRVINILSKIKNCWCVEDVEHFEEAERNGQSDMDILKAEIDYIIGRFGDCEGALGSELLEAKDVLKHPHRHEQWQIQDAKDLVAEYKQLVYYQKKLKGVQ